MLEKVFWQGILGKSHQKDVVSDLEEQIENRLGYGPDGEFVSILPRNDSYSFENYLSGKYRFEHLQGNTLETKDFLEFRNAKS